MERSLHMDRISALEEDIFNKEVWHEGIPSLMWAIWKTNKYPMDGLQKLHTNLLCIGAKTDILIERQD